MRKLLVFVMVLIMTAGLACAGTAEEAKTAGGWQAAEDPAVTEELKAVFDKGLEGLVGVGYVPVAYLGSQVVAGRNYAFLCQAKVVVPDAEPFWAILYLYEDLKGDVSILNIAEFDFGALCTYGAVPET